MTPNRSTGFVASKKPRQPHAPNYPSPPMRYFDNTVVQPRRELLANGQTCGVHFFSDASQWLGRIAAKRLVVVGLSF